MAEQRPRIIRLAHSVPGRLRLRLAWLHDQPEEAVPLAERLALLDRSIDVRIRPWTGSVLCSYDPERLEEEAIITCVRRHTRVAIVLRAGETHLETEAEYRRASRPAASSIRRSVFDAFGELNRGVLRSTDGRLDLGALAGLGFLAVGAAEIARSRALPAPPWFNLAWWAYRTFTISGAESEGEESDDGTEPDGEDLGDAVADA